MAANKRVLVMMMACALLLAVGIAPSLGNPARALPAQNAELARGTIPYAGRLSDDAGQPVADGRYDFEFALYGTMLGDQLLWSEMQRGVAVSKGEFLTTLGSVAPIPTTALNGQSLWLAVSVRGPGEAGFTALAPRQRLNTVLPVVPDAPTAGAACPHDHVGEVWWANIAWSNAAFNVNNSGNGPSILAWNLGDGNALRGQATGTGIGLYAESGDGAGAVGHSTNGRGIEGYSANGPGVFAEGGGSGNSNAALRANNTAASCGIAAYLTNDSGCPTLEIDKHGAGGAAIDLQLFDPGNVDPAMFITAYDENVTLQFLVSTNGIVGANGYIDWKADMAEMLPAAKGLESGDVLAIGSDGNLIRSAEPYQTNVAGVYSTDPGFMFGHPLEGKTPGTIPLAMAGVVPVKVSAENGPIHPGDLLVASSTPGHAMKAGADPPQGSVIGKALQAWDEGTATIKMLAMLQ